MSEYKYRSAKHAQAIYYLKLEAMLAVTELMSELGDPYKDTFENASHDYLIELAEVLDDALIKIKAIAIEMAEWDEPEEEGDDDGNA